MPHGSFGGGFVISAPGFHERCVETVGIVKSFASDFL
jgi:hypothetical protein